MRDRRYEKIVFYFHFEHKLLLLINSNKQRLLISRESSVPTTSSRILSAKAYERSRTIRKVEKFLLFDRLTAASTDDGDLRAAKRCNFSSEIENERSSKR